MTKNRIYAAVVALAALAMACADPASPNTSVIQTAGPVSAITDQVGGYPTGMTAGEVRVCKTVPSGDPSGVQFTFDVTVTGVLPTGLGPTTTQYQIVGVPGSTECTDVFLSTKNGSQLDSVKIVESAPPTDWALTAIDFVRIDDGPGYTPPLSGDAVTADLATRTATVYINNDMGRIVTFTNDFTPPATGCTYTKGWYRNNGSSTVIAVDGRSISDVQAIFAATPGKPGNVTFGGDNTLLNLYQQFLAALQNLGGDANEDLGPTAVDDAIDDVQDGTNGLNQNITNLNLDQTEMSALIAVLSAFNEGYYSGWPHCTDN